MERDYNNIFEIRKKSGIRRFIKFIIIILIISILIFLIYFLITKVKSRKKYDVDFPSKKLYAVTLLQSDNIDTLNKMYASAQSIGASGYVLEYNGLYYIVALIYPNLELASSVVSGNVSDRFDLNILEISTKEFCFDMKNNDKNKTEKINDAYALIFNFINELYELTIKAQKDEISPNACASIINNKKGEILSKLNEIKNIKEFEIEELTKIEELENMLIKCSTILEKTINELLTSGKTSTILKYNTCEYISIFV